MLNPQLERHLELLEEKSTTEGDQSEIQQQNETNDSPSPTTDIVTPPRKQLSWWNSKVFEPYFTYSAVVVFSVVIYFSGIKLDDVDNNLLYALPIGLGSFLAGILISRRKECTGNKRYWCTNNKRIQECRLRLSSLLGSIGAPSLQPIEIESWTESQQSRIPQAQLTLLEEFVKIHLYLIKAVDETIAVLKVAASMSLGLGIQTRSVQRVECAAVGRSIRRQRKKPTEISLSLPTLRRLVYHTLKDERDILRSFDVFDTTAPTVIDSKDSSELAKTIASLSTMRLEVVELLSWIASHYSSSDTLSEAEASKVHQSMSFAEDARAHLSASLSSFNDQSDSIESPLQELLASLQTQVYAIQVAILGCQDALSSGDWNPDSRKAAEWWVQINQLSSTLDATIDTIDSEFFRTRDGSDATDSDGVGPNTDSVRLTKRRNEVSGEYTVDGRPPDSATTQPREIDQKNKTFVFSGNGAVRPKSKPRNSINATSRESERPIASFTPFEAQMLIQELQRHLNAMPQADEVNIVDSDNSVASEDEVRGEELDTDKPKSTRTEVGGFGLVLGELKDSLSILNLTADESSQWEVNSSSS